MDNNILENLIYNQLYAGANYDLIKSIAPDQTTKVRLHNYAADCKNNANFLDRLYQEENTMSFHPLIQKAKLHGDFTNSLHWMLNYEENAYRTFFISSFRNNYTNSQCHLLSFIAGIINNHSIGLAQILLNR